jgi:hypothetical protein
MPFTGVKPDIGSELPGHPEFGIEKTGTIGIGFTVTFT